MRKHFFFTTILTIIFFACNNEVKPKLSDTDLQVLTQHQKDERNKATVMKCFQAYAAQDSEFLLKQSVNDVINIYSGQPPTHGNDSERIVLRNAFNLIKDYKPSNQIAVAENNYVFVFQYIDITNKKGETIWHAKQVEIFKFNDAGKIILHTGAGEDLTPNDVKVSF